MPQPRSTIRSGSSAVGARRCPFAIASATEASRIRRNSSTWRNFACRLGLIRPSRVGEAEGAVDRVVLGQQPLLVAVVLAVDLDLLDPVVGVHHGLELLGHPQLVGLGGGLDVPVAERLVEQRVDRVPRRVAHGVVGGVRLGVVVRRDLQVPAGLEVDVAELGPAPPGLLALLPAGRDRLDQGVGVEQVGAHPVQRAEQRFAHFSTAATTTITSRATSATGITSRRWRGFTPGV